MHLEYVLFADPFSISLRGEKSFCEMIWKEKSHFDAIKFPFVRRIVI